MMWEMMKRKINWFTRIDLLGYMFVLPFVIGFIFLFLKPLILSAIYSFHEVSIEAGGLLMEPVGFANYRKSLLEDGDFIRTLIPSVAKYLGDLFCKPVKTESIICFTNGGKVFFLIFLYRSPGDECT